jgi:hypothetical protein
MYRNYKLTKNHYEKQPSQNLFGKLQQKYIIFNNYYFAADFPKQEKTELQKFCMLCL